MIEKNKKFEHDRLLEAEAIATQIRNAKGVIVLASTVPPKETALRLRFKSRRAIREYFWKVECLKTFRQLPAPHIVMSASEAARQWGCSHPKAKKMLQANPFFIQVTKKYFTSIFNPYKEFYGRWSVSVINSAVSVLRGLSEYDEIKSIPKRHVDVLLKSGLLAGVRSIFSRGKLYFVPSFIISALRGKPCGTCPENGEARDNYAHLADETEKSGD